MELLIHEELPEWFKYPATFLRLVKLGLVNLEPWFIMPKEEVLDRLAGLHHRYPDQELLPFARRSDCDEIACFEKGNLPSVTIVHDFATAGWEKRATYPSFKAWFRQAINDLLDFEPWTDD